MSVLTASRSPSSMATANLVPALRSSSASSGRERMDSESRTEIVRRMHLLLRDWYRVAKDSTGTLPDRRAPHHVTSTSAAQGHVSVHGLDPHQSASSAGAATRAYVTARGAFVR